MGRQIASARERQAQVLHSQAKPSARTPLYLVCGWRNLRRFIQMCDPEAT